MKKITFMLAAAAVSAAMFTSCNKSNPQVEAKSAPATSSDLKVAYVEVDSIMTQYQFCIDTKKTLEAKAKNGENALASKAKSLDAAQQKLQSDYQNNRIQSQQEFEGRQAAIQKQAADAQALQQRFASELAQEQDAFNQALHDSIANFLKAYNKDKKYTYILSKSGDNMLYADPANDITKEVIAGLNKAYKPGKKVEVKETPAPEAAEETKVEKK